jgi:anti-sigma regulatory factor (Ser/Thr protein kinase)
MTLLQLRIPPNPCHVRKVREQLLLLGDDVAMMPEALEDFVTAIGEAFANAIEHARSSEPVEIEVRQRDTQLVATIRDHGQGIDTTRICSRLPPATTERGRGIPLMRQCSSSMSIQKPNDGGTLVVLHWSDARLHGLESGELTQTLK